MQIENIQQLIKNNSIQLQPQLKKYCYCISAMTKNHEKILQLHSTVSKLYDTLCFELCINKRDDNSLGLLQYRFSYVGFYSGEEITKQMTHNLYNYIEVGYNPNQYSICSLADKANIPTDHPVEFYHNRLSNHFLTQINNALELVNFAYNRLYIEKRPTGINQLEQIEKIFFYLDSIGYSHLRLSSVFFLTAATVILERLSMPVNYEFFKIHMNNLRKQLCEVGGIVSLRCFKNYFLTLPSNKKQNYLQNIFPIFSQLQALTSNNIIPNIFDELFTKWITYPRFTVNEMKKNLQIFRRVFEQNQSIFYDEGPTFQHFVQKYSQQFVKCFQIDQLLLKQFSGLLKQCLNHYIEMFCQISEKIYIKKNQKCGLVVMTHRKKPTTADLQKSKSSQKVPTPIRQKTPIKSQKIMIQNKNRTPTKNYIRQSQLKKQFNSIQKLKLKTSNHLQRQITPNKTYKIPYFLHQSQTNTIQQQTKSLKIGIDKDSVYNKMIFFRNKRIQSYQFVMKRLKNK